MTIIDTITLINSNSSNSSNRMVLLSVANSYTSNQLSIYNRGIASSSCGKPLAGLGRGPSCDSLDDCISNISINGKTKTFKL